MKSISSAIVTAVGVYGLVHTAQLGLIPLQGNHGILHLTAFFASMIVTALGLVGWWSCLKYDR